MNPEFRRNLWLELTRRRVTFMVLILGLIFFATALSGGGEHRSASVAEFLYYFIVVFWGSRNASLSVVGEIRDRTWDSQRLSSLSAGTMTWGKLFGSTAYNWLGGGICLVVLLTYEVSHQGAATALIDTVYYVGIGVISQAAALLASMIAARRRQTSSRLGAFLYQIVGIVAAVCVYTVWNAADPGGSFLGGKRGTDFIAWWGQSFDARPFLLVSLALFAMWTLLGCYRAMRLELKLRNGPLVWLAFLVFMGIYAAGFDAWLPTSQETTGWDVPALRLFLAASTFTMLTYAMVLLEPKEQVLYRWIGSQIADGRIGRAASAFQAWMVSYFAAFAVAAILILYRWRIEGQFGSDTETLVSALGFFTRDVAIFVLLQSLPGRRRGDFAAVVALLVLYAVMPAILNGLDLGRVRYLFYPGPVQPVWLGPAVAWAQALAALIAALTRIFVFEEARTSGLLKKASRPD